jgi:transcriptional regulator with XRE-family HTH domain
MEPKSSPLECAKRLKILRQMAGLTAKRLSEISDIGESTIRYWEEGRAGGLSRKGAHKLVIALANYGIECTEHWLLEEIGEPPRHTDALFSKSAETLASKYAHKNKTTTSLSETERIQKETEYFHEINHNTITIQLNDNGVEPFYLQGDIIGGIKVEPEHHNQFIGKTVLVETEGNEVFCRQLHKGSQPELYNLSCTNTTTTVPEPILFNIKIVTLAEIVWIRRRSTLVFS